MSEKLTGLQLQLYYNDLTKKEKAELIKFLMIRFDYSYCSIRNKFLGTSEFNKRDLILLGDVITEESWRQ